MSSRGSSPWLFGAAPDLLFGAGLLYALVLVAVTVGGSVTAGIIPASILPFLVLIFSGAHYGGTLLRVFEYADDRRTYRTFTVYATGLMLALLLGALHSPVAGSLLITIYLTWSPWHYTGQNYGIALMFLRRRGVEISPAAKRWLYASFVCSYLSVFVNFHFDGGVGQADPLGYTAVGSSGFEFVSLGLPGVVRSILLPLIALGAVGSIAVAGFLLVRASSFRAVGPAALVVFTQAAWFSIPHLSFFFEIGGFIPALSLDREGSFQSYFVWAALGHAVQYLWITSYYARRDERWRGFSSYLTKAFVFGNAVWATPLVLFGPDTLGRPDYGGGLALCVAAAVNLHHFIVDGAIWKLRNPKVAAVLLHSQSSDPIEPSTGVSAAWKRRLAWSLATLFCFFKVVPEFEIERRLPRALASGNFAEAEAILDRAAWYGRDSSETRTLLANTQIQNRKPMDALSNYWRSLELRPHPDGYAQVGVLVASIHGLDLALPAWKKGLAKYPDDFDLNRRLGLALLELRRANQATPYLEAAAKLRPDDASVNAALDKSRNRAGR